MLFLELVLLYTSAFRVVSSKTSVTEQNRVQRELDRMAHDNASAVCKREVIISDDPVSTLTEWATASDLLILGVQRLGPKQKLFGSFTREIAKRTNCPIIVMSRR